MSVSKTCVSSLYVKEPIKYRDRRAGLFVEYTVVRISEFIAHFGIETSHRI